MNKYIKLGILIIIVISVSFYLIVSKDGLIKSDNVTYALTLDGNSISEIPSKGMYEVNVVCNHASGKWLYNEWKLIIDNITGNVSCNIDFVSKTFSYFNNYIIGLSETTQGTGEVVNENGYRYEGKNPNNYVWFNNEYWRIIGVFDSTSHGQSNKNLVKIIRDENLNSLVWDKNQTGNWQNASLNSLLNGAYYNALDGTDSGYCYIFSTATNTTCDYRKKGIQDDYRGMISNAVWYLGGSSSTSITVSKWYESERSSTVYSGYPTSFTAYIGLMYPSDYGYSVLSSSCARTKTMDYYYDTACAGNSWIYGQGLEWTISMMTSTSYRIFHIMERGQVSVTDANISVTFRPVLYLDSSVYVIDGDGSLENPYIIGM